MSDLTDVPVFGSRVEGCPYIARLELYPDGNSELDYSSSNTLKAAALSWLRLLHEVVGFLGEFDPVSLFVPDDDPLLHYSSVARVEALALAAAHELIDAFLRELQNELALRRHHREDLAIHLEGAGAEALPVLPADVSVLGEGFRSEEHTSELQSQSNLVCRLLLEKKKK